MKGSNSSRLDPFPIRHELKGYTWAKAKADFRAGLNVALLDFPQGMACALLIGLPVIFGVYASAIASIVGPLLASSRFVILGPTNATAVLVLSAFLTLNLSPEEQLVALPVLLIMVGIFMIAGAFLKLAGLIKYVSRTVMVGYITAVVVLIVINQLDTILGGPQVRAATFADILLQNVQQLSQARWESLLIMAITVLTYSIVNRYMKSFPTIALVLLIVTLCGIILQWGGISVVMLETIPAEKWPWGVPKMNFDLVYQLGGTALGIAFLAIIEGVTIAKNLAARSGERVDINQHMLSMGAANITSAFGSGIVISGSLTRSMLNWTSGARTAVSSVVSGIILIAGIYFIGPYIVFIPQAALATIIVIVALSLINFKHIRVVVQSTQSDAAVFFATLLSGLLFPLNIAIYFGAAASIVLFLRKVGEPNLIEYSFNEEGELRKKGIKEGKAVIPEISIVHVEGELFFGSIDIFLDQTRLLCESPNLKVILLRVRNALTIDASSAMAIADLIRFAHEKGRAIVVSGANEQVERVFRKSGTMGLLGEENFFRATPENPNIATRNALKRAQEIMGVREAKIILFAAASK